MKNKLIIATLIAGFALPLFAAQAIGLGVNVSASTTVNAGGARVGLKTNAALSARVTTFIQKGQQHADEEITRRIKALNDLSIRVNGMVRLSSDEKASLSSTIQ